MAEHTNPAAALYTFDPAFGAIHRVLQYDRAVDWATVIRQAFAHVQGRTASRADKEAAYTVLRNLRESDVRGQFTIPQR